MKALSSFIPDTLLEVVVVCGPPGGKGTPYDGLYRDALPERGTFFRL